MPFDEKLLVEEEAPPAIPMVTVGGVPIGTVPMPPPTPEGTTLGGVLEQSTFGPRIPIPDWAAEGAASTAHQIYGMTPPGALYEGLFPEETKGIFQSLAEAGKSVGEFLESPGGFMATQNPVAGALTFGGMAVESALSAPGRAAELGSTWDRLSRSEKAKGLTDLILQFAMPGLMGISGYRMLKPYPARVPKMVTLPENVAGPGEAPPVTGPAAHPDVLRLLRLQQKLDEALAQGGEKGEFRAPFLRQEIEGLSQSMRERNVPLPEGFGEWLGPTPPPPGTGIPPVLVPPQQQQPTPGAPDAIHSQAEAVLRNVQQPGVPPEGPGQVPLAGGVQEAGPRSGVPADQEGRPVPLTGIVPSENFPLQAGKETPWADKRGQPVYSWGRKWHYEPEPAGAAKPQAPAPAPAAPAAAPETPAATPTPPRRRRAAEEPLTAEEEVFHRVITGFQKAEAGYARNYLMSWVNQMSAAPGVPVGLTTERARIIRESIEKAFPRPAAPAAPAAAAPAAAPAPAPAPAPAGEPTPTPAPATPEAPLGEYVPRKEPLPDPDPTIIGRGGHFPDVFDDWLARANFTDPREVDFARRYFNRRQYPTGPEDPLTKVKMRRKGLDERVAQKIEKKIDSIFTSAVEAEDVVEPTGPVGQDVPPLAMTGDPGASFVEWRGKLNAPEALYADRILRAGVKDLPIEDVDIPDEVDVYRALQISRMVDQLLKGIRVKGEPTAVEGGMHFGVDASMWNWMKVHDIVKDEQLGLKLVADTNRRLKELGSTRKIRPGDLRSNSGITRILKAVNEVLTLQAKEAKRKGVDLTKPETLVPLEEPETPRTSKAAEDLAAQHLQWLRENAPTLPEPPPGEPPPPAPSKPTLRSLEPYVPPAGAPTRPKATVTGAPERAALLKKVSKLVDEIRQETDVLKQDDIAKEIKKHLKALGLVAPKRLGYSAGVSDFWLFADDVRSIIGRPPAEAPSPAPTPSPTPTPSPEPDARPTPSPRPAPSPRKPAARPPTPEEMPKLLQLFQRFARVLTRATNPEELALNHLQLGTVAARLGIPLEDLAGRTVEDYTKVGQAAQQEFLRKYGKEGPAETTLPLPGMGTAPSADLLKQLGGKDWLKGGKKPPTKPGPGLSGGPGAAPARYGIGSPPVRARIQMQARRTLDMFRNFSSRRDLKKFVAATADAVPNLAMYVSRQAGNSMRLAADLDENAYRAATFYRQARNDIDILEKDHKARLESVLTQKWDDPRVPAAAKNAIEAIEYALAHVQRVSRAAREAGVQFREERWHENNNGMDVPFRSYYVPGRYDFLWDDDAIVFGDQGTTGASYKKGKVFPDYVTAIENGYVPLELRLDRLLEARVLQGQRAINRSLWAHSFKTVIDPATKEPVAKDMIRRVVKRPTGNTVEFNAPGGYVPFEIAPGQRIAILRGFQPLFHALTATSHIRATPLGEAALKGAAFLKHSLLMFDTFHISRVIQSEMAGRLGKPGFQKGLSLLDLADRDLDQAVQQNLITQDMADWVRGSETLQSPKGPYSLSRRALAEKLLRAGYNIGKVHDAIYREVIRELPWVGKWIGDTSDWIFERLTRGAMLETALDNIVRFNRNHPDMPIDEVVRKTAHDGNVFFGNLGKQGLFKNQTFIDLAMLTFLAPRWVESLARKELTFATRLAKAPISLIRGKRPEMGLTGAGMGTGLLAYFVITQAVNLLTRGNFTWHNPEEGHKLDAWIPSPTGKTPGQFFSPFGVFAEIFHDIVRYFETKPSAAEALTQIGANKLSPLGRAALILGTGHDSIGSKIPDTWGRVKAAGMAATPFPLGAAPAAQWGLSKVTGGRVTPPRPGVVPRQLWASIGFKTETGAKPATQITRIAHRFLEQEGLNKQGLSFEFTEEPSYTNLRNAIVDGQDRRAEGILKELRKTHDDSQIIKAAVARMTHPFTGSNENEALFLSTLTPEQDKLYDAALDQRIAEGEAVIDFVSER